MSVGIKLNRINSQPPTDKMPKPLKRASGQVQFRDRNGRFTTPVIECGVCLDCRAAIVPIKDYSTGIIKKSYPTKCHQCGSVNLNT